MVVHELLQLKNLWHDQGWLGEKANRFGSPDCVLLHSGGPATHLATFSLLCGPSRLRATIRQPDASSINQQAEPDFSNININQEPMNFDLEIEEWKHGAWYHKQRFKFDSLSKAIDELRLLTPGSLFESIPHQKLPEQPFWVAALSYDVVQWTQPLHLQYNPNAGNLLACFYLVEQGCVYDCLEQKFSIFKVASSHWNPPLEFDLKQESLQQNFQQMEFSTRLTDGHYVENIEHVQRKIVEGTVYQVNIGQVWQGRLQSNPWQTFCALDDMNPAPYSAFFEIKDEGISLVSSSPECLLESIDDYIHTAPIKGTIHTGVDEDENEIARSMLLNDDKERAEHRMLVDLMRNDLGLICEVGSVKVDRFDIEQYASVQHLVSRISGKLKRDVSSSHTIEAVFPGGSITGCPRTMVCHVINQIEQQGRSFWTGSIGWFDPCSNNATWNILIRTIEATFDGKQWYGNIAAGGGITISSDPHSEVDEAFQKARPLLHAAGWIPSQQKSSQQPIKIFSLPRERNWQRIKNLVGDVRLDIAPINADVLFVDNLDSFSMNIVHSITAKGYSVQMVQARLPPFSDMKEDEILQWITSHPANYIVIGPGPGRPENVSFSYTIAQLAVQGKLKQSVLGVCLGHQAIGLHGGFELLESPFGPVHGKPCEMHHGATGLFNKIQSPWKFTRYNSLVLQPKDKHDFIITSTDEHGEIMSIAHSRLPVYGVQFHPESVGSQSGEIIFSNFLKGKRIVEE
jgi:anthranilate synthase